MKITSNQEREILTSMSREVLEAYIVMLSSAEFTSRQDSLKLAKQELNRRDRFKALFE